MVDYTSLQPSDIQIQLTDASGRIITQQLNTIESGTNHITVSNLEALSAGQYFIKIKDLTTGDVFTRKIVK
jgi:hypothetical protein